MSDFRSRRICTKSDVLCSKELRAYTRIIHVMIIGQIIGISLSTLEDPRIYIYNFIWCNDKQIDVMCCTDISLVAYKKNSISIRLSVV